MAIDQPVFRVVVAADEPQNLMDLLRTRADIDFGCRPRPRWSGRGAALDVLVSQDVLDGLQGDPEFSVEVLGDAVSAGRASQDEVGKGDRFDGGRVAPTGMGEAIYR